MFLTLVRNLVLARYLYVRMRRRRNVLEIRDTEYIYIYTQFFIPLVVK